MSSNQSLSGRIPSELLGPLGDFRYDLAENPLWHSGAECLYWTDIPAGRVHRYSLASGVVEKVYEGKKVGGFTIQDDQSLLLFMEGGAIAQLKDEKLHFLIEEIPEERTTRFNDVIADPHGRVFCGTMPTENRLGRLYRLDRDGTIHKLLEGIGCSNGLAFSADLHHLYYTDSHAYTIYRFDYHKQSGEIDNQEVFIRGAEIDGYPDGLTSDMEGHLWSARWGGGCIIRYSPRGVEEGRVQLPAKLVTSMTFGGSNLSELYVTSARDAESSSNAASFGGSVFRVRTDVLGRPEFTSRIDIG